MGIKVFPGTGKGKPEVTRLVDTKNEMFEKVN